jgi:predicted aldo/keto reductase-like oxidoreductase
LEKIRLGKTNMMVSRLGFGGIPIQRLTEDEAVTVVKRCLDLGITFIDTANAYTTSEERIGKAISGRREGLILATKSTSRSREEIATHLQLSLKRLGVETIDLYQFHNVSDFETLDTILDPNGPMAVVEEAKNAGKIRHIGITSHQIDVAKKAVASGRFETIMFPLNFVIHKEADELLPLAREHDVGFIAMKPLAGGMISNAKIAFKYLFQLPDVVPIPGIQKVPEIEEIVQILAGPRIITESEQKEMRQLKQKLGTKFCHRCDYCQPCTADIQISIVMSYPAFAANMPQEVLITGFVGENMEKAASCTECGECEERCPYGLPIIEIIAEHLRAYQTYKKNYQKKMASRQTSAAKPKKIGR